MEYSSDAYSKSRLSDVSPLMSPYWSAALVKICCVCGNALEIQVSKQRGTKLVPCRIRHGV